MSEQRTAGIAPSRARVWVEVEVDLCTNTGSKPPKHPTHCNICPLQLLTINFYKTTTFTTLHHTRCLHVQRDRASPTHSRSTRTGLTAGTQ